MLTITLENARNPWDAKRLIFTVPLPGQPPVYMSRKVHESSDECAVVIVDPAKFVKLWRNEPCSIHKREANGNAQTWRDDYKFDRAALGFSLGLANPVPLAEVSPGTGKRTITTHRFLWFGREDREEEFHYVAIGNGVTRTVWLLAHACGAMPVCCEMPGARELHRIAAVPGTPCHLVRTLAQTLSDRPLSIEKRSSVVVHLNRPRR